jgi:type II secretory pathway predicted ATPase ExeA
MLATIAARLKLSLTDMATACGLPRTTAGRLLTNEFPVRANDLERQRIRTALHELFANAGATPEELAEMWFAHARRRSRDQSPLDVYGGPRDHVPGHAKAPVQNPEEETEMLLPKQALTTAARRHFKLFSNPFDGDVIKDDQMFNGDDVRYVREAAWQCAQNSSFVAVVGESGAGKTTIQTDLEERIRRSADPVTIIKPSVLGMEQTERQGTQLRSGDILHAIITQLDPQRSVPQTLQARTVLAHKLLAASAEVGNTHLLVVEEAHSMPNATLKHLKRLHEMRLGRRPLLGILLLAQTELKTRLANGLRDGSLREVAQRCEVVELLPLDNDLRAYLECRASAAGVRLDALMDGPAVDQLRARLTIRSRDGRGGATSMCYPLAVNNMMTKCLNEAAELGVPMVNKDIVAAA